LSAYDCDRATASSPTWKSRSVTLSVEEAEAEDDDDDDDERDEVPSFVAMAVGIT
jgi:hypothetical protein